MPKPQRRNSGEAGDDRDLDQLMALPPRPGLDSSVRRLAKLPAPEPLVEPGQSPVRNAAGQGAEREQDGGPEGFLAIPHEQGGAEEDYEGLQEGQGDPDDGDSEHQLQDGESGHGGVPGVSGAGRAFHMRKSTPPAKARTNWSSTSETTA